MSKLPTAEETLSKYTPNREYPSYYHESDVTDAIESHTQAHTEGLMGRIAELETATNRALEILEHRRQATPGLGASIIILKTALEDRT